MNFILNTRTNCCIINLAQVIDSGLQNMIISPKKSFINVASINYSKTLTFIEVVFEFGK